MKILFLTLGLPFGPHGGAKMRNRGLIRGVAGNNEVHVLCITWHGEMQQYLDLNRQELTSVVPVENLRSRREIARTAMRGLLKRRPLAVARYFADHVAEAFHQFLLRQEIDLIVIEESLVAPYMEAIPRSYRGRVIIDFHNVVAQQYRTMTHLTSSDRNEKLRYFRDSILMRRWEARFARRADHCIVVSEEEKIRLRKLAPHSKISVIPNGTTIAPLLPEPKVRNTLLFVGIIGYQPNADAVRFCCSSILPRIRQQAPDTRLYVVGLFPPPDILALGTAPADGAPASAEASGGVIVTGEVPDVQPYYENSNIAIVPLRAGGGTRLKILEAMSLGRPVVTTSLGCEGLDVKHGEHLMIADNPDDFADRVLDILQNPGLARRLTRNARKLVETQYDWRRLGADFARICHETVGPEISPVHRPVMTDPASDLVGVYRYSGLDSRPSMTTERTKISS